MDWNQISSLVFLLVGIYALVYIAFHAIKHLTRKISDTDRFMKRHVRFDANAQHLYDRQRKRIETLADAIDSTNDGFSEYLLPGRCRKLALQVVLLVSLKRNLVDRIDEELGYCYLLEPVDQVRVEDSHRRWVDIINGIDHVINEQMALQESRCI